MIRLPYLNIDDLIKFLFMAFAFLVPFEMVLEVLFGIETIFKPYRTVGLLIIFLFGLRTLKRWSGNHQFQSDIFLYLLFTYGLLITGYKMMSTDFNMGYFLNDTLQIGIYMALFVIARHMAFTAREIRRVFFMLMVGSTLNALWVFQNFFIRRNFLRSMGFMDNANYFALSIVISLLLIVAWRAHLKKFWQKILALATFILLLVVLTIAGSRTGLAILVVGILGQLYYASWKEKRLLIALGAILLIPLVMAGRNFINDSGKLILFTRLQKALIDDNRLPIWEGVIRASEDAKFMGLGIGQFKSNFHKYFYDNYNDEIRRSIERSYFRSPHSDYLAIIAIYGIVGLLCYLVFMTLSFMRLFHKVRSAHEPFVRIHYQYVILIFVMLVLFGITQENFFSPLFWLLLSFSSLVTAPGDSKKEQHIDSHSI